MEICVTLWAEEQYGQRLLYLSRWFIVCLFIWIILFSGAYECISSYHRNVSIFVNIDLSLYVLPSSTASIQNIWLIIHNNNYNNLNDKHNNNNHNSNNNSNKK